MQTVGTQSGQAFSDFNHPSDGMRPELRCEQEKKNYSAKRCCNSFLRQAIPSSFPSTIYLSDEGYNLITQENYEFLRDSYFQYAKLLGQVVPHKAGRSLGESIGNLYNELQGLLKGSNISVNLEACGQRLYFNLWCCHNWGAYTLYWFPVRFVEDLNPQLRRIVITFFHELIESNFMYTNLMDDVDMCLEWIAETLEEYSNKERKEKENLLYTYSQGRAHKLLARIKETSYYKRLSVALDRYAVRDQKESRLLELMRKGLHFIGEDKPAIMDYSYNPYLESDPDVEPLELERQIRIVYDTKDYVTDMLEEYYNSQLHETYELIPTTTLALSPQTDRPFAMDDYPERFMRWADEFLTYVNDNYE